MGKNTPVLKQGADAVAKPVNVLSDRNQTPMLPIDLRAVPLEPRVMLDANLEFDINASTALTSVLSSVAQLFDEQIADITDFLDTFDEAAGAAFDKIGAIVDTVEGVSSQADASGVLSGDIVDLSVATETVQRIRDAIDALRGGVTDTIADLIAGDFYTDLAADVRSQLEDLNNDVTTPPDPLFESTLSVADVTSVYTVDNFSSGAVDSTLDTLISGMDLGDATAEQVKTMFHDAIATAMGLSTGNFSVALDDIAVGGETLVSFTQDGDFAVDVAVNLPQAFADFQAVLQAAIPGISLPFDALSQGAGGSLVEFEIETHTTFSGDILTGLAVDIHEFAFAPLLEVGGTIGGVAGAGFNLGLLALEVTSLETAKFGLFVTAGDTGGGGMNLGGSIDVSGTPTVTWAGSSATLDVTARIQEIGATGYSDIVADQVYELIDLDLEGELDFSAITQEFTAGITLTSVLDSTDAAGRLRAFIDQASFDFTLDLVNTGLAADQEKILEDSLVTLATMGTEQIVQFLKDIGETVSGALSDSAFDIAIPLTDVRFGNLMTELSSFFTDLASTFTIDQGAFGFSDDSNTESTAVSTSLTEEVDARGGVRLSLSQFTKLLDFSSFDLTVLGGSSGTSDVTIDLAGTDVHDTSKSLAERMDALATLLNTAVSGAGIAVTIGSNGGLSFKSDKSSGGTGNFSTFAIRSGTRTDGSKDDSFSLFDLGFDLSGLSLVNEATAYSLNLFSDGASTFNLNALNLDLFSELSSLTFNVSIGGGAPESLSISSPSTTGWATLTEFADAFNAALELKGWGISVSENATGSGLDFAAKGQSVSAI
mgnify:CR=1 FL=1